MKKNSGFTLIEVLISVIILALALLGQAGLQLTGMKNNLSAYHRTQATQLAYDMADRIRANLVDSITFNTSIYNTITPANASVQASCTAVANACTPAQMAQQDLYEWRQSVAAAFPTGKESISVTGRLYTIAINWDDNRDGCTNPTDAAVAGCGAKPNDPVFDMVFQL